MRSAKKADTVSVVREDDGGIVLTVVAEGTQVQFELTLEQAKEFERTLKDVIAGGDPD